MARRDVSVRVYHVHVTSIHFSFALCAKGREDENRCLFHLAGGERFASRA